MNTRTAGRRFQQGVVRASGWALATCLYTSLLGCETGTFDKTVQSVQPARDAEAKPSPRDASVLPPLDGSPGVEAGVQRDAGARNTAPHDAAVDAQRSDGSIGKHDAEVAIDLCGQQLPAAPSASGVLEGSVRFLDPVAQHPGVRPRGPAYTARFGTRMMWLFGATTNVADPFEAIAKNTYTLSGFDRPERLDEALPEAPLPSTFVPELAEDLAQVENDPSLDYLMGSLIPIGPTDALVFYTPTRRVSVGDEEQVQFLGTRVAHITAELNLNSTRAVPEPALIFPDTAPSFRAGLLARDGYVFLYGCPQKADSTFDCLLARAPLGSATTALGFQYRTVGGWSNDLTAAIPVLRNVQPELSISYNAYLRRYLVVSFVGLTNDIVLLTAERPEGPFVELDRITVPEQSAGPGYLLSAALEHAELSSKCGKRLVLTYVSPVSGPTVALIPIEFELR